jgi:hypothetical protein
MSEDTALDLTDKYVDADNMAYAAYALPEGRAKARNERRLLRDCLAAIRADSPERLAAYEKALKRIRAQGLAMRGPHEPDAPRIAEEALEGKA